MGAILEMFGSKLRLYKSIFFFTFLSGHELSILVYLFFSRIFSTIHISFVNICWEYILAYVSYN